ncbi:MAG: response regulator [Proteobacteria bacterium]|nr:response regulator [Pseudomonadota bacterium]MBU4316046.1 response regulator [Pseudomonadota bacterium]MBU4471536.1 response regulator [Pseudomonadota bacterium]MCG2752542.1 response regulator [Desulfobacteraceae bacterium]
MALNVLIVDDSGVMRAMIKKTLQMTDIEFGDVLEAKDGQQGLEILKSQWIDLVLADINMPVMNGEEMINQMKADLALKDVPVVVISTEGSETRIERLKEKGVKFIRKPFTPEIISEVINDLIGTGAGNES